MNTVLTALRRFTIPAQMQRWRLQRLGRRHWWSTQKLARARSIYPCTSLQWTLWPALCVTGGYLVNYCINWHNEKFCTLRRTISVSLFYLCPLPHFVYLPPCPCRVKFQSFTEFYSKLRKKTGKSGAIFDTDLQFWLFYVKYKHCKTNNKINTDIIATWQ